MAEPLVPATPEPEGAKPYSVLLRLGLMPFTIHFKSPQMIKQSMLDSYDVRILKKTLSSTVKDADVR
jgi:hypothetical protein